MRHAFMNYKRKLCKVTSFKKKAAMIRGSNFKKWIVWVGWSNFVNTALLKVHVSFKLKFGDLNL